MAASSIVISGTISGTPTGVRQVGPVTVTSATPNGSVQRVVLAAGDNTILCPVSPQATGCLIQLNSSNTSLTTLKGVAADTGVPIGKTGAQVLTWESANAPASIILNSASAQAGVATEIQWW